MSDFALARHNMVESQIKPNKVTDPAVLAAFAFVPRERFVPASLRGIAYVDEDVRIADGRYLMEPMVLDRPVNDTFDMAPPGGEPPRVDPIESTADALAKFDENVAAARDALEDASDERLLAPWTLLAGGETVFTLPRLAS